MRRGSGGGRGMVFGVSERGVVGWGAGFLGCRLEVVGGRGSSRKGGSGREAERYGNDYGSSHWQLWNRARGVTYLCRGRC